MFKKVFLLFVLLVFTMSIITVNAEKTKKDNKPKITATAYVLYNPDNDEIVESKNADNKMYPASLTKMMTALTVLELCEDIDSEKVTVSDNAIKSLYGTGSSSANIKKGEIFTVRQLLYLMLLPSGNDAANALSDHFTKNNSNFIDVMNDIAKKLGMNNTNFANAHGLHDKNHYTTAYDLAILADAFMSNQLLYEIANTNEYKVPKTNIQEERDIRTTNFMKVKAQKRYYYPYSTGLKTGYTTEAGRCFAGSAEKDGVKFILISLKTPELWDKYGLIRTEFLEAADYFDYAFDTYKTFKIANKNQKITTLPVFETYDEKVEIGLKNDLFATLVKDTNLSEIKIEYNLKELHENKYAITPKKGEIFGNAKLLLDDKLLGECEIIALNTVEPNCFIVFWHTIDLYVYIILGIIGFLIFALAILVARKYIVLYLRKKRRKERELMRQKREEQFSKSEPYDYFKMD